MNSIDGTFTIVVNGGSALAKPAHNAESRTHASFGPEPAILQLKDGRIESGDWLLGRFVIEDRSLLPKRVYWFRKSDTSPEQVQHTFVEEDGNGSYKLRFGGAPPIERENQLFAELIDTGGNQAEVKLQ